MTTRASPEAWLNSTRQLSPKDFRTIASKLGADVLRARKIGFVAAQKADKRQVVETRWNGKETINTAHRGDWIVTNLSPQREVLRDADGRPDTYVIAAVRFTALYEVLGEQTAFGEVYRAKGTVLAIALPGGFDIKAPWGERQVSSSGYLLCNGEEVYGCNRDAFASTYEILTN